RIISALRKCPPMEHEIAPFVGMTRFGAWPRSHRAGAVDAGVGAGAVKVAGAAVGMACAGSALGGETGAAGAVAEATLGGSGAGCRAVAAAVAEAVDAVETSAAGTLSVARAAATGGAGTVVDEEIVGSGAADIGLTARRALAQAAVVAPVRDASVQANWSKDRTAMAHLLRRSRSRDAERAPRSCSGPCRHCSSDGALLPSRRQRRGSQPGNR
ncbi:MAG: hypothetical protein K0S78_5801, partial [Thermomicrobiales bacterium]|nr:hypothetical protein [Thermomicrobiales bacterium]